MLIAAIVVIALIAIVLALAASKPSDFRVARSTVIQAPAEKIFPLINDLHAWGAWSPYEHLDPAMKRTFSGATSGPGAIYEWKGNSKAGEGRMEILSTVPPSKVSLKLDFLKPFEGHNVVDFTLQPRGADTEVAWIMNGPSPFMSKVMSVFVNMDHLIGKGFEEGLAKLRSLAEK